MFAPILSPNFRNSAACYDESHEALQQEKPVLAVVHDPDGWKRTQEIQMNGSSSERSKSRFYESLSKHSLVPRDTNLGGFFDDFWTSFSQFTTDLVPYLKKDNNLKHVLHGVIACAPQAQDLVFAEQVKNALKQHGLDACVCSSTEDWKACRPAVVFLPVLSNDFYNSSHHTASMVEAACNLNMPMVPVRLEVPDCSGSCPQKHDPAHAFFSSCFNRANRVPANENFAKDPKSGKFEYHMRTLAAAIRTHAYSDRTEHTMTLRRIPM